MNIYYYCPQNDVPSWGIGVLLNHVKILNNLGYKAYLLFTDEKVKFSWIDFDLPYKIFTDDNLFFSKKDILIIPEVLATDKKFGTINCRKILFIQNSYYLFSNISPLKTFNDYGFECAFIIMPHMNNICKNIINLKAFQIRPFVDNHFFLQDDLFKKEKLIVLYPKINDRNYEVLKNVLFRSIKIHSDKSLSAKFNPFIWKFIELDGYTHIEVSEIFKRASIFVNCNLYEAFNTTIPEAFASRVITYCYDLFPTRDFIIDNVNAYTASPNSPYELAEKLVNGITRFKKDSNQNSVITSNAYKTAMNYTYSLMVEDLKNVYSELSEQ